MRIFKNKLFHKWAIKEGLTDLLLRQAIEEMEKGLFDANLGGHVYKKRIGVQGCGKRGGVRTLIAFKQGDKAFFVYGFAKNQQANLTTHELQTLKQLAKELLGYGEPALKTAIQVGKLIEV